LLCYLYYGNRNRYKANLGNYIDWSRRERDTVVFIDQEGEDIRIFLIWFLNYEIKNSTKYVVLREFFCVNDTHAPNRNKRIDECVSRM